jgi:anti-sigma regulatory factor (Ser/Thr protein kinase)
VCEQAVCAAGRGDGYGLGTECRGSLGAEFGAELGTECSNADAGLQLQRALLPPALPVLPQAQLAAGYWTADGVARGDWFDVVLLGGGIVVMVVGDVVGRGVAAAAAMSQLRAVLSDRMSASTDLGDALAEADSFAGRTAGLRAATVAVLALDPATGRFRYATCGSPPPLVVAADGSAHFLPTTRSGPLGCGSRPVFAPGLLGPDELVLLYTDGLLKRPDRLTSVAMAKLAKVAADARASRELPVSALTAAERLCQLTVAVGAGIGARDEIVTLAAHRLAAPAATLQLELPGTLAALRTARRALTAWLDHVGAVAADRAVIQLAISEVILNAAEHAYPADNSGPIGLHAALCDDGYVEFRITDHGTWRAPGAAGDRGRGLMMVEHLLDDVVISHPPQAIGRPPGIRGTMVTLRHRLSRPAILAEVDDAGAADWDDAPCHVQAGTESDRALAAVYGAVDELSATQLTRELLAASRGGTLPLTVDLTGVTQLGSAGVRALFEVRSQLAAHCQPMSIVALVGSGAAFVLDLVRLSYQPATDPAPIADVTDI